jgi:hypothetical protein
MNAIDDITMKSYPNTRLREKQAMTSLITPMLGRMMM